MPKAIPGRIATQMRIDETLHKKAREIAIRENRTLNSQYEYFIKVGVEQYETVHGPISVSPDE
ncbi:MAG: hypothetical protein IJE22_08665 [Oscillibacter sp.]|nr:hypothetical protein [Oscillibacter sp.]